ncbi:MAG: hypothetical protein U5L72_12320 [Bacteroidales bacterium]|nr:hypothetical protein [Bacteroidales bacterium]
MIVAVILVPQDFNPISLFTVHGDNTAGSANNCHYLKKILVVKAYCLFVGHVHLE